MNGDREALDREALSLAAIESARSGDVVALPAFVRTAESAACQVVADNIFIQPPCSCRNALQLRAIQRVPGLWFFHAPHTLLISHGYADAAARSCTIACRPAPAGV
jgi:hypothetical protein